MAYPEDRTECLRPLQMQEHQNLYLCPYWKIMCKGVAVLNEHLKICPGQTIPNEPQYVPVT